MLRFIVKLIYHSLFWLLVVESVLTEPTKHSNCHIIFRIQLEPLAYTKMDFEEFCAAAINPYHLEALDGWEQIAITAFEFFELEGNRVISIEELARVITTLTLTIKSQTYARV